MLSAKIGYSKSRDPLFPIIISILVASVLTVYPLSYTFSGWRPCFMFIVMLFWVLCQPTWCGVWFAFATGIFTDLLLDAPLGLNAFSFVVITFIARYLTRERRIMTFMNLWIITILGVTAYLTITFLAHIMSGTDFVFTRHWTPWFPTVVVWPIFYYVLKRWRI
ncbi:rod shape-determining protein MreD [Acinetobacter sp. ANC 4558]|uniref:rod shape-determining protein MreD n=1 Tax=Acinetobacter sp. ANC 4558 TaxID=1977876 RepID=UPI000A3509B1|nr:rod shape-determining protein MreD [Acinetobacter sp. ANC 4558]OTG85869.1 rod shape-determining protein MreD [Acinetobacter sp. ANC 4558]